MANVKTAPKGVSKPKKKTKTSRKPSANQTQPSSGASVKSQSSLVHAFKKVLSTSNPSLRRIASTVVASELLNHKQPKAVATVTNNGRPSLQDHPMENPTECPPGKEIKDNDHEMEDNRSVASIIPQSLIVNNVDWPTIQQTVEYQKQQKIDTPATPDQAKAKITVSQTVKVVPKEETQKASKKLTGNRQRPKNKSHSKEPIQQEIKKNHKATIETREPANTATMPENNSSREPIKDEANAVTCEVPPVQKKLKTNVDMKPNSVPAAPNGRSVTTPAPTSTKGKESKNNNKNNNTKKNSNRSAPNVNSDTQAPVAEDDEDLASEASGGTLTNGHDPKLNDRKVRYRLILTIPKLDKEKMKKELKVTVLPPEATDPDKRLHKLLSVWFDKLKTFDSALRIMPWAKDDEDKHKNIKLSKDIPPTPASMKKYFLGASACEEGTVFAQVRLYSKLDPSDIVSNMQSWLIQYKANFQKSIVQSEWADIIGWLAYSSAFSDLKLLKKEMEMRTDFEWGFKIGPITDSDRLNPITKKPIPYKDRQKAVQVVVSRRHKDKAYTEMRNLFSCDKTNAPAFAQRMIFLPIEKELEERFDDPTNYLLVRSRHQTFNANLSGHVSTQISSSLDRTIYLPKGKSTTLRKMILSIKSRRSPGYEGYSLFQGIDVTSDGSKVFFKNKRGPSGPGHIFSYLSSMKKEALMMARGLPVYLAHKYGKNTVINKFTISSWTDLAGWSYDNKNATFITPDMIAMEDIVKNDPMAKMLAIEEKAMNKAKKADEKNKVQQQAEQELLKRFEDSDLDSVQSLTPGIQVKAVQIPPSGITTDNSDEQSTTSSVTYTTDCDLSMASDVTPKTVTKHVTSSSSTASDQSSATTKTDNTLPTFMNSVKMKKAWDNSLSESENLRNQHAMIQHSMNKFTQQALQKQAAIEARLKQQEKPKHKAMLINLPKSKEQRDAERAARVEVTGTTAADESISQDIERSDNNHEESNTLPSADMNHATSSSKSDNNTSYDSDFDNNKEDDSECEILPPNHFVPITQETDEEPRPPAFDDSILDIVGRQPAEWWDNIDPDVELNEEVEKLMQKALAKVHKYKPDPMEQQGYHGFMTCVKPRREHWSSDIKFMFRSDVIQSPLATVLNEEHEILTCGTEHPVTTDQLAKRYFQHRRIHSPPVAFPIEFPMESVDQYRQRYKSDRPPDDEHVGSSNADEQP